MRLFVISASRPRNVDLCVSGAVRRDFDVAQSSEICAHAVSFARAAFSCIGRGPVPVIRELHVRCACVCTFAVHSVVSCACALFFACGGLTCVEHWACPRLWRIGRASVFVFTRVFMVWFFVRGLCQRWMFVVASAKCSACQSVFIL